MACFPFKRRHSNVNNLKMLRFCCLVFFINLAICSRNTEGHSLLTGLLVQGLLESDNIHVRPDGDAGSATQVRVGLNLNNLESVAGQPEWINIHGFVCMHWTNPRLTWNPKDYGNISKVHIPANLIWTPDIALFNGCEGKTEIFSTNPVLAIVKHDGSVSWCPRATLPVGCNVTKGKSSDDFEENIECSADLGSWTYSGFDIDLKPEDAVTNVMSEFSPYNIVSSSLSHHETVYSCCPEPYVKVSVKIQARTGTRKGTTSNS